MSTLSFYGGIASFVHPSGFDVRATAVVFDQLQGLFVLGVRIHVEVLDPYHILIRSEDYRFIMILPFFAFLYFVAKRTAREYSEQQEA